MRPGSQIEKAGVWGAVLCAGAASRFGGGKQLAKFQGRALAAWPAEVALAAGHGSCLDRVLVVLGDRAPEVAAALPVDPRLETVLNPEHPRGMGSSLALAARLALDRGAACLVVLLGDQPLVQPDVIARVAEACRRSTSGMAAALAGGRRAHPVAFSRKHFADLARLAGDQGGRDLLTRPGLELALVEAPEESSLDVDNAEDLARAETLALSGALLDWAAPGPLCRALGLSGPQIAALAGGGGKTTLMLMLAREIAQAGRRAVVTTTTRIFPPRAGEVGQTWLWGDATPAAREIARRLEEPGPLCVAARLSAEGKLTGLGPEQMEALARTPELWTLVEADGSARRPLKGWAGNEPAWPAQARTLLVLAGASGLGRTLGGQWAHRPEIFGEAAGIGPGDTISPSALARVLCGKRGPLRNKPLGARAVMVVNQSDAAPPDLLTGLMTEVARSGAYARLLTASLRQGRLEVWGNG